MGKAEMWIGLSTIATMCFIFLRVVGSVARLPSKKTKGSIDEHIEPRFLKLLCAMVGSGFQIQTAGLLALLLLQWKYNGVVIMGNIIINLWLGVAAGYFGVWLWKAIEGCTTTSKGWITVSGMVACFSSWILFSDNFFDEFEVPLYTTYISLNCVCVCLWFCILLGGYLGDKAEPTQLLVLINKVIKEIPSTDNWFWFLFLGSVASWICISEITIILLNTWEKSSYIELGLFLFVDLLLFASVCAAKKLLVPMQLVSEQSSWWWWKPFFAVGGPLGLYTSLRTMAFPVSGLKGLVWLTSFAHQLMYSLTSGLAVMLLCGAYGFFSTFILAPLLLSAPPA